MNVTALVVSGFSALQESVKSFARADDSLEELLNYQAPYDKKYVTDADIWKVLLPVVRVSQFLPSMEYQFIPHVTVRVLNLIALIFTS